MKRRDVSGNLTTWSVIIGVLLCVILFLGAAYAENALVGFLVLVMLLIYTFVLSVFGRINVVQILWGHAADEEDPGVNTQAILMVTAAVAVMTLGALFYDLVSDGDWGWYSWLAGLLAAGYLASAGRHRWNAPRTSRHEEDRASDRS